MPDKEQLIAQVEAVLSSNENAGEEDIRYMSNFSDATGKQQKRYKVLIL